MVVSGHDFLAPSDKLVQDLLECFHLRDIICSAEDLVGPCLPLAAIHALVWTPTSAQTLLQAAGNVMGRHARS